MRTKYAFTHKPASTWLIAICFALILIPPLFQALHFHPVESDANHCSGCQTINSSTHALPLIAFWVALTAIALLAAAVESASRQYGSSFSLLSRPPPLFYSPFHRLLSALAAWQTLPRFLSECLAADTYGQGQERSCSLPTNTRQCNAANGKGRHMRNIRRRGGPVLRLRGRKHVVGVSLTKREMIQVVIFLFLVMVILLLAIYVSWWMLQEERQEHRDHNLVGPESAGAEMHIGFDS